MGPSRCMNPTNGRLIAGLLVVVLISGCLSSPELEVTDEEGPGYEEQEWITAETGPILKPGASAWSGVAVDFTLVSYVHTFQRPTHLHEAHVVFRWTALTDGVFDEARVIVHGSSGSAPWTTVSGTGDLEFMVDAETWDSGEMSIWLQPWSSSAPAALYLEWEYEIEITFVERVPVQLEDAGSRGTG